MIIPAKRAKAWDAYVEAVKQANKVRDDAEAQGQTREQTEKAYNEATDQAAKIYVRDR